MSLTVSPGLVKARQWTAVAARVIEYLDISASRKVNKKKKRQSSVPKGSIYAAMQFFEQIHQAVKDPTSRKTPVMAGISNFSIAVDVLAVSGASDQTPESIAATAKTYSELLRAILEDREPDDASEYKNLLAFMRELETHGNRERETAISLGEQSLRTPELFRRSN